MRIVKVYEEYMTNVKLIGKRYLDKDRDECGSYAGKWQQWFQEGWFDVLQQQCGCIDGVSDDFLGVMHNTADGFEYWIGSFFEPESQVPEGFEAAELAAGAAGVCWLYGNEKNGELFGRDAYDLSMAAIAEQDWKVAENGWFWERYHCPRFTEPDELGNVILDLCAYLVPDEDGDAEARKHIVEEAADELIHLGLGAASGESDYHEILSWIKRHIKG